MKTKSSINFEKINRILIIKLRHHGDVLLSSPVFQVLKNHYPHLELDALVYEDTKDMLSGHPSVDQLHCIDRSWKKLGVPQQLHHEAKLLSKLKKRHYDLIIHLTEHNRGVILAQLLRPKYAITAYRKEKSWLWQKSFTHHYPLPFRQRHTVEKHLDALRHLGLHPAQSERSLVFNPGKQAESRINSILDEHLGQNRKFIVFHPTSRWMFKSWSAEKASHLIQMLQDHDIQVVITAAPSEKERSHVEQILKPIQRPVINLTGELNLRELGSIIEKASLFIGMDSVPMHLAAAMKTPSVALFGPSGDKEWAPWMVQSRVLTSDISCRPCGMDGCGGSKISDCLEQIPPSTVFGAAMDLLNNA